MAWTRVAVSVADCDGGLCRARSGQGHRLGHAARTRSMQSSSREGKIDAFLGFPPAAAGAARAQARPCDRQQRRRPTLVAVFLLHAGGHRGFCAAHIRWRPSASCAPSSRPRTSASPSRSGRTSSWSMRASPAAMTTRCRR